MKKLLLLLLLLIPLAAAQDDDYLFSAKELLIEITESSSVDLVPTKTSYTVDEFNVNLIMFPKNSERQEVISIETTPDAEVEDDKIHFEWNNPTETTLNYKVVSKVKTRNDFVRVSSKVSYPISNIDGYEEYIKPTEKIDSNNNLIINTASQLAEGEDDLFVLENKLASYIIDRVEYNLSTLTAEANQKASWVLINKYGVCDELTNLFIAFNRALGIPARAISGVAYTNSPLFDYNWGPHAWAEVYFPGHGWVPFDLTYGEIGWVDATHVGMMHSADSSEPSTKFEWRSSGINISPKSLDIDAKVISSSGTVKPFIEVKVDLFDDDVGFGSYNLVEARVTNLMDYYVPVSLTLANVESINILSQNKQGIVIPPKGERNVLWIIKVDPDLRSRYIYTFPMHVYAYGDISDEVNLSSDSKATEYSYDDVYEVYSVKKEEVKKVYSKTLDINCTSDPRWLYLNETSSIVCSFWNRGNIILDNLQVCLQGCSSFNLNINQKQSFTFDFTPKKLSDKAILKINNKDISKIFDADVIVTDIPQLNITGIDHPKNVTFDDEYVLKIHLDTISSSDVKNVKVTISQNGFSKAFDIPIIDGIYDVTLSLTGGDLHPGSNTFTILATYPDKNGVEYKTEKNINIELVNVTFWQRIKIKIYDIADFFFGRS